MNSYGLCSSSHLGLDQLVGGMTKHSRSAACLPSWGILLVLWVAWSGRDMGVHRYWYWLWFSGLIFFQHLGTPLGHCSVLLCINLFHCRGSSWPVFMFQWLAGNALISSLCTLVYTVIFCFSSSTQVSLCSLVCMVTCCFPSSAEVYYYHHVIYKQGSYVLWLWGNLCIILVKDDSELREYYYVWQ